MKIVSSIIGIICVCSLIVLPSCNKSDSTVVLGNWIYAPDYKSHPRAGAFAFTIGNTAYVGLGHDGLNYRTESFSYNIDSGYWKPMANFPGKLRERPVAFSIGDKGYVGTGYNRDAPTDSLYLNDFWEFDPTLGDSGTWTRIADFKGSPRSTAVAFADGQYGYVGTGFNGDFFGDFYRYDPGTNSWKEIPDYPGRKREQASIMQIDGKVYLMAGLNNGAFLTDIWLFNPESQSWTNETPATTDAQYANFKAAVNRYDAVTFTLDGKGYIATGTNGQYLNTVYQFDPVGLIWTKMTPFERAARSQAVAFVLDNRAFLTTGGNSGFRYDDMNEFNPTQDYDVND